MKRYIYLLISSYIFAQPGILNVGFDIDDTVLYSEPVFQKYIEENGLPIDFSWINTHDIKYSIPILPTVDLVHFFKSNGHHVYFITARSGENGVILAEFLTNVLKYKVQKNVDLFFMPKDTLDGIKFTSKHRKMKELNLDLFYGDSDTDIIAALKAGIHPVRIVRHEKSIEQYGENYFGNTTKPLSHKTPFHNQDLNIFYDKSIGVFGESIYPIIWEGPKVE